MGAFVLYNFTIFLLCKKTQGQKLCSGNQISVGSRGKTTTPLCPDGMVQVKGELWKARANCHISKGEVVTVEGMDGLVLYVTRLSNTTD